MNNRFAAPVPEVHYLPSLFRKIQSGELRIPAFQRGFVWKEKNILQLMESIYLGYPIGSLLFWKASAGQLKEIPSDVTSFPVFELKKNGEVLYILDGMQRMSTLYGVFHKQDRKDSKFRISYDFIEQRFFSPSDEGGEARKGTLALESLFNPREFLAFQAEALNLENADEIIAKSIELQSVFQEYLVPTVTINDRDVPDVVEIFSRVNSTGVKLDIVDFVRALTWSSQFDMTLEVNRLAKLAQAQSFDLDGQTFVKLIAICAHKRTISDDIFKMSEMEPAQLREAVDAALKLTPVVISKLVEQNSIVNSHLLGYEGQFLIWAAALLTTELNLKTDFSAITKLVWQIGFGETLRGKPDDFLERILQKIYSKSWTGFIADFRINDQLFITRRYLSGKALSSAVVSMQYERQKDLISKNEISSDFEFDGKLFPALKIDKRFGETRSDKILANLIGGGGFTLGDASFSECAQLFQYVEEKLGEKKYSQWLKFNYLDKDALPSTVEEFLEVRAKEMRIQATILCGMR